MNYSSHNGTIFTTQIAPEECLFSGVFHFLYFNLILCDYISSLCCLKLLTVFTNRFIVLYRFWQLKDFWRQLVQQFRAASIIQRLLRLAESRLTNRKPPQGDGRYRNPTTARSPLAETSQVVMLADPRFMS